MPDDALLEEMVRRMKKFDEAPSSVAVESAPTPSNGGEGGEEESYDTPGLMFSYARRSAERVFGGNSIYV